LHGKKSYLTGGMGLKISVEFLGGLKASYGVKSINLEIEDGMSVEKLIDRLCHKYDNNSLKSDTLCLVNGMHSYQDRILNDGDEVVFSYVILGG
jgi:molybdopterin converting factor small subunit